MKLIAKSPFFNAPDLGLDLSKSKETPNPLHIPKGLRFAVGKGSKFKDLTAKEQEVVGTLLHRNLVAFDDEENATLGVIKTIDDEVSAEKAAADKAEAAKPKSQAEEVATAVINALIAAGIVSKPK